MSPCKICGEQTNTIYNINFSAVHICNDCGRSIFLQQAQWYAEEELKKNKSGDDWFDYEKQR